MEERRKIELFLDDLPSMVKNSVPAISKIMVLGSLGLGTGGFLYGSTAYEFYSPQHTNSFSLFISMLAHLSVVIGPAALYG